MDIRNPRTGMRHNQSNARSNKKGAHYFCDHYKIVGHSVEICLKIHGYPPSWKPNQSKRAVVAHNLDVEESNEASSTVNLTTYQYN